MDRPDDLGEFWARTKAKLAETPMEATRTPAPELSSDVALVWHVAMKSWEGRTIYGWYAVPPAPEGARLGGLLWLPGFAEDPDVKMAVEWAEKGFATLVLVPRGQGRTLSYPDGAVGKIVHGIEDPARYSYRAVYMDCLRGFEFLLEQPECHPQMVAVAGGSQGGGLALATSALSDGRAAVCAAHIPFLCDFAWLADHKVATGAQGMLANFLKEHPDGRETLLRTFAYFDAMNLAGEIVCPVFMSAGLRDETCPHETIAHVFDRVPVTKMLLVEPEMIHEWRPDTREHMRRFMAHYLG